MEFIETRHGRSAIRTELEPYSTKITTALPKDIDDYRYITIRRPRGVPISADEAKWILRNIGVSEDSISALTWERRGSAKKTTDGVSPDRIDIGDTLYIVLPDEQQPGGWYISEETVADVSKMGYYRSDQDDPDQFSPLDGSGYEVFWNQQAAADRLAERIRKHENDYNDPFDD